MSGQFTPGRLYYSSALPRFDGDEAEAYVYYCIVWQATDDPENPALFCETPNRQTMAEAYADARLISAAPDLLAALEKAAPFIGWASTRGQILAGVDADELCDIIDAAIAKATGAA